MMQTGKIGRATFHHIAPQRVTHLTNRQLRWMKSVERHGPQSSVYLHELTKDTHRCKDTSLRQLQKLRAGGYLHLPRQQRATEYANFKPFIYDLTPKAKTYLFDQGLSEPTIRPTGHWWHGYMTSCVTSSIDIMAAREGTRYIPTHEILKIKDAPLAVPIDNQCLIPDQIFALGYGGSFRAFALEVDRGTEPKTTSAKRKSYANSIELYRKMIERDLARKHFGLKAPLLVLWVFNSRTNEAQFLEIVAKFGGSISKMVLTQSYDCEESNLNPISLLEDLFSKPWNSATGPSISLQGYASPLATISSN